MSSTKLITTRLLDECIYHIAHSETIYLLISFAMESGVRLLDPYLRVAAETGADIKILTGDYLFVTQPAGLEALHRIHPTIELRLWRSNGVSFHPKAYLFRKAAGENVVIVGSSNLSHSALTNGVEWNLAVESPNQAAHMDEAEQHFLELFYAEQTIPLNPVSIAEYHRAYGDYHRQHPNLAQTWTASEALDLMFESSDPKPPGLAHEHPTPYVVPFTPRPAQLEALNQLAITRAEGYDKALVVMATGLGKTYMAAMFAKEFTRVLFIAHREEILLQAKQAFEAVSPDKSAGLFTGRTKDVDTEVVFASIMTLGMKRHRLRFPQHHFNLVIVDEFHHAAAMTYSAVIDWFRPEFLLGLTATPDRADGREVYALCDRNVAYRVEFLEAVQRGWLSPFHYIGVYDETDYSQIRWLGTRYDEQELLSAQTRESMAQTVFEAWQKHRQSRGLAFCSSVAQAKFLANYFQMQGVRCVCLHGATPHSIRSDSTRQLTDGELDLIFTVDLFNEGVDIPSVDTLLFVRPTESLTIFTQQVGRGLRTHPGKSHCTIIDLIGNYRNADIKLTLFNLAESIVNSPRSTSWPAELPVPDGCKVDLDLRVIDLIREMKRKKQPRKDKLREAYHQLKLELGLRPTYVQMHLQSTIDSREIRQEFGSYIGFLAAIGELDTYELAVYEAHEAWLREVESTGMTKAYKMVVLLAMLERGPEAWFNPITAIAVAPFVHRYYVEKPYRSRTDFSDSKTSSLMTYDEAKLAKLIAEMPMTKWSGSSKGLVRFDGTKFWIDLDADEVAVRTLFGWTKDVCLYRLHVYFERKDRPQGPGNPSHAVTSQ